MADTSRWSIPSCLFRPDSRSELSLRLSRQPLASPSGKCLRVGVRHVHDGMLPAPIELAVPTVWVSLICARHLHRLLRRLIPTVLRYIARASITCRAAWPWLPGTPRHSRCPIPSAWPAAGAGPSCRCRPPATPYRPAALASPPSEPALAALAL